MRSWTCTPSIRSEAMPTFINKNNHPVRVPSQEGQVASLPRIMPGQVVEADGFFADRLAATPGVDEASGDEASEYRERRDAEREQAMNPGPALRQQAADLLGPARVEARMLSVVGPLQRVIGDDQAPYAPPTGTITTKQAVRREAADADNQAVVQAFGPNEAYFEVEGVEPENPIDATVRSSPSIHNTQAANQDAAEEAANRIIDPTGEGLNVGNGEDTDSVSGDYGRQNKVRLMAEAKRRNLDVQGTGDGDTVTKPDLIRALEDDDKQRGSS
jgi:hypothetical protein